MKINVKIILLLTLSGCAGPAITQSDRPHNQPELPAAILAAQSSVDIQYVFGHAHRRFTAHLSHEKYVAQDYLDHQTLKENEINGQHYQDFLQKTALFIRDPRRATTEKTKPAAAEPCRTPFTVTLRIKEKTEITHGCRETDDGGLAHLIREGEFLMLKR